jgi:hypothetical protein
MVTGHGLGRRIKGGDTMDKACRRCENGRVKMPVKTKDGTKELWVVCPHCGGRKKGFATK